MINITNVMTDLNYDLSGIANNSIIDNPAGWLSSTDQAAGGYIAITILAVIGLVLFLTMRESEKVNSDSEAFVYAGLITTFAGILLFVIDTGTGAKLITWVQLVPFILLTAIGIFINFTNRKY